MRESPNLGLHLTTDEDRALNVAQWVDSQTGEGDSNMMKLDTALGGHLADKDNPHGVSAEQVGADPEGSAAAVQGALDDHASDRSIHPSAEDVEATATVLSRHLGTPALHVADEERTLWNAGAQIATEARARAEEAYTLAQAASGSTATAYTATLSTAGWTKGAGNANGQYWYEYTVSNSDITASDLVLVYPADSTAEATITSCVRGFVDTVSGGVKFYANAVPAAINIYYSVSRQKEE